MAEKSRILIIGGTGYLGKFIVEASAIAGHPTFVLVRESALSDRVKGKLVWNFKRLGVNLITGDVSDHVKLVKAMKEVDVVISTLGIRQYDTESKIVAAVKEAGNIKRYFPSDFGTDVDNSNPVEPAKSAFVEKAQIRRAVEAAGIPHTFVSCNCFFGYFISTLAQLQPGITSPPEDKVSILGDGKPGAVFVKEEDIAAYTIRAVDDARTLNKVLHIKPPKNILSFNELVALWEKKIGKTLEKNYIPEDQILKNIKESPEPMNLALSLYHGVLVTGDQTKYPIDPQIGVEASELYPDVKYTTVEECLDQFV